MRLVIKHDLPRRLRYAEVYFQLANASAYISIDGNNASWYARIGRPKNAIISDKEYSRLRAYIPLKEVVDDNGEFVILRNRNGEEERWFKPRWILAGIRKIIKWRR